MAVFLLGGLTACGGGGSGSSSNGPDDPDTSQGCDSLTWSKTQAEALGEIEFLNASGNFATAVEDPDVPLYGEARPAGEPDAEFQPLPIYVDDSSASLVLSMQAPLNPGDVTRDKSFDITLTAGDVSCEGPTVDVAGMAPGSGTELDDYLSTMKDLLVTQAGAYGYPSWTSLVDLRQSVLDGGPLPPLGMQGVMIAVDSLLSFEAEVGTLSAGDRAAIEAFMAHLEVPTITQSYLQDLQQLGAEPIQTGASAATGGGPVPHTRVLASATKGVESAATMQSMASCYVFSGDKVSIGNAYQLDWYMRKQKGAEDSVEGIGGDLRQGLMAGTPLLGLVSGGAATVAGLALYIEYTIKEYTKNTLPSQITKIGFDLTPGSEIPEDYEIAGNTAYWNNAYVNAASNGHDLTGAALDGIAQALGAVRWLGATADSSAVVGFVTDITQNKYVDFLKENAGAADCLQVPAFDWRGIDVQKSEWSKASVYGDAFTLGTRTDAQQNLSLQKIGTAELVVETADGKFAGRKAHENVYVSVNEQVPSWEPGAVFIDQPGAEQAYTITVDNTERPNLLPGIQLPDGVTIVDGPTASGGGVFTITLKSPTDDSQYPAEIGASRPGVLEPQADRIGYTTMLSDKRITVTPATACIEPGSSLTLEADVIGFTDTDRVNWSVTSGPGTVSPVTTTGTTRTAAVTSSGSDGVINVEVVTADDSSVSDSSRISVGSCDSQLHVYGNLVVSTSAGGETSRFNSDDISDLMPPPDLPMKPGFFWRGHTEYFSSGNRSEGEVSDWGIIVAGDSEADLSLVSDANGGLTYSHNSYGHANECVEDPDPDSDEIRCSAAGSGTGGAVSYYIDLDAATTLDFTVEGTCSRSGDSFAGGFVTFTATRLVGGSINEAGPPNGPFGNYPDYPMDPFIEPMLISTTDPGNICTDANGGTFSYSATLELGPPVVEGETDLVVVQGLVASAFGNNTVFGVDLTDHLQFAGGDVTSTPPAQDPETRKFMGTGEVEFTISLTPQ